MPPLILACLAATWVIWGSTYLAIKWALVSFPPYFQIGSRFFLAGVLLLAYSRLIRRERLPTALEWRNALFVGVLMLAAGTGGCAFAEQTIGSGIVVAFVAVVPLLVSVVNLFFGVRPRRIEVVAMVLGLAGALLLSRGTELRASPAGLAALTLGTIGWAAGSVLSQRRWRLAPGSTGYASEMLCGGAFLLVLAGIRGEVPQWPPEPLALASWFYLLTFGSLVAFSAYMVLLARAPASLATSYSFVNPLIGLLLGVTLDGETIRPGEWFAVAWILSGVFLLLWQRGREPGRAA